MIEKIFIISFLTMFIWATMLEGNIFGFVRTKWFKNLPEYWQKPIFDCPICLCPYYGTALYWLIFGYSWQEWLIVIFCAAGVNTVFVKLFPPDE